MKIQFVGLFLALTSILNHTSCAAALAIGGWNSSRGGSFAVSDGSDMTNFRAAISGDNPSATYSGTNTLTPAYLATLNVILIGSAQGDTNAITPLTSAEQTALLNFVLAGGRVLIFTDNDAFAGAPASGIANNSLLSPFGLHATGTLAGSQTTTVGDPSAAQITSAPYGTVNTIAGLVPGHFDQLGSSITLANWSDGGAALAYLPRNALAPGSGAVMFVADANFTNDFFGSSDNSILIRNAVSGVPEPSAVALLLFGGVVLLRRRSEGAVLREA